MMLQSHFRARTAVCLKKLLVSTLVKLVKERDEKEE